MKFTVLLSFYLSIDLISHSALTTIYSTAQTVAPNDVCTNAASITIGSKVEFDLTGATLDDDITNDCFNNDGPEYPGVWYTFTGTGARLIAQSCNLPTGSTYISIFSGGCGAATRTCVAATTEACGRERFTFDTVAGATYHVLVQAVTADLSTVDVSIVLAPDVPNDFCTGATPLTLGTSIVTNTSFATSETSLSVTDDCIDNGEPLYPGLWYTFVGTGYNVTFSVGGFNLESSSVSIFSGGCDAATRTCVAAYVSDILSGGFKFDTTKGTTYHALVQFYFEGSFNVEVYSTNRIPCGLFRLSIFCPLTFQGIFARGIRALINLIDWY